MKIQMSFSEAYQIRSMRYLILALIFIFITYINIVIQVNHKNIIFDIIASCFGFLTLISLAHAINHYRKSFHVYK